MKIFKKNTNSFLDRIFNYSFVFIILGSLFTQPLSVDAAGIIMASNITSNSVTLKVIGLDPVTSYKLSALPLGGDTVNSYFISDPKGSYQASFSNLLSDKKYKVNVFKYDSSTGFLTSAGVSEIEFTTLSSNSQVHTCPMGQVWDEKTQSCVVYNSSHTCPKGQVWDNVVQACVLKTINTTDPINPSGNGSNIPNTNPTNPSGNGSNIPTNNSTQINTGIKNPLGNGIKDLPSFIEAILNIVLVIGVPLVTLAIIYTGFLFVQAQGNAEKLSEAKKAFVYVIIGATLLLGSFVIAKAIKGTVDEIKSTT